MSIWSAVGQIGGTLLGGLFGKKKDKPQVTKTEVDYQKMVDTASAAGFNPLTAIRNGGSAGFATTTSPSISQSSDVLSNLGGILGDALGKKFDPIEAKKREIDTLLVDRQLRQLKEGPQVVGAFKQPRLYYGTKVSQQLVPRAGLSGTQKAAAVPAAYKPQNTNLVAGDEPQATNLGLDYKGRYGIINPGWLPDAGGAVSDALGEPGEWVGGIANMGAIGGYSIYRNGRSLYEDLPVAQGFVERHGPTVLQDIRKRQNVTYWGSRAGNVKLRERPRASYPVPAKDVGIAKAKSKMGQRAAWVANNPRVPWW